MRLKREFIAHEAGAEAVLVPTADAGFSGVVRGNGTLGAILGLLGEDTTERDVVAALRERFDAPAGAIERDVARALGELRRIGALDG
ncbi:MAG: PqqD family protein [Acidobacteriota bacterium]|nr:PqqD family protein [Acidobacteriota bacterium]